MELCGHRVMTPVKNSVQRGIPCCSGKKEALLDVVVVCVWLGGCVFLCVCVVVLCVCLLWCVWLCVLVCCVVCVFVVVCRTHSQDHGIHIHTDVHVGVTVFAN